MAEYTAPYGPTRTKPMFFIRPWLSVMPVTFPAASRVKVSEFPALKVVPTPPRRPKRAKAAKRVGRAGQR